MDEKETSEFKIRIDKERPEHYFQEAKKDLRFEKLNQRVAIISILVPCIIVLLIIYSYFDIRNKISGVHDSGIVEIEKLSKDFDKKISGLSLQYSKLEESFDKRMTTADKTNYSMKSHLENLIKKTEETKMDKTELASAISALNSQISNLKTDLSAVSSKIKDTNINLSQKISDLSKALVKTESELSKLQANISIMLSGKADKKELELFARDQLKQYQNELSRLSREFEVKIETIRKQLIAFEKRIETREIESKAIKTGPSLPATQLKPDNLTKPVSVSKGVAPKPGAIVEQDLK
jgi:predicted  nucleic acid-binding Zn-ribbon protein